MNEAFYLGIDFGTSGARAIAINAASHPQAEAKLDFPDAPSYQLTDLWRETLMTLIQQLPKDVRQRVRAIAINGTSSTVLRCNDQGQPFDAPILYHDDRGKAVLGVLKAIAPSDHPVISATSSLAKLVWWSCADAVTQPSSPDPSQKTGYFLHQADWLAFLLHGRLGVSDYHNSLKLGYDVGRLCYPDWMRQIATTLILPEVVAPGTPMGVVQGAIATQLGLPADCRVCAGTTDSIAAFLASGATTPGDAVTSLGSTLVLKLLSRTRVDCAQLGIYSHRLGDLWLVGGASNTGGAVLKQFFSDDELARLSQQLHPEQESPLDYYPLTTPGERFPVNDPSLPPRLSPQPDNPADFLHGLLESMARIEARGYQQLQQLGATSLRQVYTAGGGAKNSAWSRIRARHLGVPVSPSPHPEAALGTAKLAQSGSVAKLLYSP